MVEIIEGDCLDRLRGLPEGEVDCCVTSPPYWGLRDYGVEGQLGLEETPGEYVEKLVEVFREVRRPFVCVCKKKEEPFTTGELTDDIQEIPEESLEDGRLSDVWKQRILPDAWPLR